ncbi:Coenzyme F420 hydrogenase/dehydrogenase, beta subunit C-terminal domain, partial [Faecalibacterium prausnitzii]
MLNCKKENCTGCGVCAYSCPKSAINMVESVEGFLYPKVDRSLCVDCNLCNKVCPSLKKPSIGDFADCYAVQLINKTTLRHCASGGAFYGIAQTVLEQNGAIFGVVDFGTELRYQKATSLKELDELTGSKYFQCAISEKAYGEIIESTQKGLTLVSGTPCMVAAIRNLQRINRKNLLTFEILCQGVPSKTVIEKFYSEMAAKYGSPVQNHVFRSKDRYIGRNYLNRYEFKNGKVVYLIGEEDPLSLSFQRQIFLRESCYSCQYANEARTADFTAGDLWKTDVNGLDIERGC